MPFVAAATAVVGTGAVILSSRSASKRAKAAGKVGEQIAQVDAAIAKVFTHDQIKQRNEQLNRDLGTAAAKFSASGVDIASGSPLLVQAEIARIGLEDIEALIVNGQLNVYRAALGGAFSRQEASATAAAARAQGISALSSGINTLATNPFVISQFATPAASTATVSIGGGGG